MKKRTIIISLVFIFAIEIAVLAAFAAGKAAPFQDSVAVNEAVHSVQADLNVIKDHINQTSLDYVVLDKSQTVLFKTKEGLSESLNAAVIHRDTILDIETGGAAVGKIIIYNDSTQTLQHQKQQTVTGLMVVMLIQCVFCISYILYLNRMVIRPFCKLKGFARRIADGNLDVPLEMDRQNLFGAFTESFDIMRAELKKARCAEAEANAGKKELVAKLSHDIKTPVASIKAASEVGAALTDDEKIKDNYNQIIRKADQINSLITNLFTATLEELRQLSVTPADMESTELTVLLNNADYLHRAVIPESPDCLLYADKLRLQQVFDNIFANSYKYAETKINVTLCRIRNHIAVGIEDYGGGVSPKDLPLLKEKFKRGRNAKDIEGAGLGLFISDHFMKEMNGELMIENGENGLKVTVMISLSGTI